MESEQDPIQSRAYEFAEEVHLYEPEHLGYKNTKKISAILSGHSHKEVDQIATNQYTNQPIAIGQASTAGRMYTDLQLTFDNTKEPGTRWIVPTTQEQKDEIIKVEKVDIDYGGKNPESKDPVEKEEALKNAAQEYVRLLEKPKDEYQASVAGAFFTQRQNVNTKLKEVIATSDEDIKYSPLTSGKQLGHEYIMPDHICDQMGA
ncbi:MAG: hypothetical protein MJ200_02530 [Mycoplasmoidaceae bacterium]|nr:hypothetical protein [Mycoplasmoidaceae bacterium]